MSCYMNFLLGYYVMQEDVLPVNLSFEISESQDCYNLLVIQRLILELKRRNYKLV